MKHFCLLSVLLLLISVAPAVQAEIGDSEAEDMVRDLLYMKAQQWHAVRGQAGTDYASLELLQRLNRDETLDGETMWRLVEEWEERYHKDLVNAVCWCERQAEQYPIDNPNGIYWQTQIDHLLCGPVNFAGPGTSFDQMRAWAYFHRFYGSGQPPADRWNNPVVYEGQNRLYRLMQ